MNETGICWLVGAGPGDPGLLTVKAKECLERADVVVHDALSSPEVLRWVRPGAEVVDAGKRAGRHAMTQEEINALLVARTAGGQRVVRLKGGDPMVFGRGGEEAGALAVAGLRFEIVPGISSAIGGLAYAGIPVTHRDHCSQLTIFTGHEDPAKGGSAIDYAQLARAPGTKVLLMGASRLREITAAMIAAGADPATPAALTRWVTTGAQRTLTGTLADIAAAAAAAGLGAPAVAVIGGGVRERERLNWFETKPLFGRRIVVTRTREQASDLSRRLADLGAEVIELPTIRIADPPDRRAFAAAVTHAHEYDWLVFTSPNGVRRFFDAFFAIHDDARCLGRPQLAVIGEGTAAALRAYRFGVDLMPERFGRFREYALGKNAGKSNIIKNLETLGIELDDESTRKVTARIIELGDKKEIVNLDELPYIVSDVLKNGLENKDIQMLNYSLTLTDGLRPTATVKLSIKGEIYQETAAGDGQYHAFSKAMYKIYRKLNKETPELIDYEVVIPPGGQTNAYVQTIITWKFDGKVFKTRALDIDQTVAAIKATLKMLNMIESGNIPNMNYLQLP